jgi:hypothetical protein
MCPACVGRGAKGSLRLSYSLRISCPIYFPARTLCMEGRFLRFPVRRWSKPCASGGEPLDLAPWIPPAGAEVFEILERAGPAAMAVCSFSYLTHLANLESLEGPSLISTVAGSSKHIQGEYAMPRDISYPASKELQGHYCLTVSERPSFLTVF